MIQEEESAALLRDIVTSQSHVASTLRARFVDRKGVGSRVGSGNVKGGALAAGGGSGGSFVARGVSHGGAVQDTIEEAVAAEREAERELERELELEIERQMQLDQIHKQLSAPSGQWM